MSRVGIIGDLHLGKQLYGYDLTPHIRRAMYSFFNFCLDKKVTSAICLGDVYDRPAPSMILQKIVMQWVNEFEQARINLLILVGNHDACSSRIAPSALESLRISFPFKHISIIDRPTAHRIGTMLPYPSPGIFSSNRQFLDEVSNLTKSKTAFSHLNVPGADMGSGFIFNPASAEGGDDPAMPAGPWKMIVHGHIHGFQEFGKHHFIGSAERLSFAGCDAYRLFGLLVDGSLTYFVRTDSLPIITNPSPAADIGAALVKIDIAVNDFEKIDMEKIEKDLLDRGALKVVASVRRISQLPQKYNSRQNLDPIHQAEIFTKKKIKDKAERKIILKKFREIQQKVVQE